MSFDPTPHLALAVLAGSHAHGTAGPSSDVDVRGMWIAPLARRTRLVPDPDHVEGLLPDPLFARVRAPLLAHPTAAAGLDAKVEGAFFEGAKLLGLLVAANPNALEILFADPRDRLFEGPGVAPLLAARGMFLTKKIRATFEGYATAQLRKIQTHRGWLLEPPHGAPRRADFGLPEESLLSRDDRARIDKAVEERLRAQGIADLELDKPLRRAIEERLAAFCADVLGVGEGEVDEARREVAVRSLALPRELVSALSAERRYRAAQRHWDAYRTWLAERNPARAELERAHGYDTKHAMHLVRLLLAGRDALRDGELRVRSPHADELLAIRRGAYAYDALVRRAEEVRAEVAAAERASSLADDVTREAVEDLWQTMLGFAA